MALEELAGPISSFALWLQALGIVIIVWLLIQFINWLINHKRLKTLYSIKDDIIRIEEKLDKVLKAQKIKSSSS